MSALKLCSCDNCDWEGSITELRCQLAQIPDLAQRLDVGSEVPAGECPECGALAYEVDAVRVPDKGRGAMLAVLTKLRTDWPALFDEDSDEPVEGGDFVEYMGDLAPHIADALAQAGA